MRLLRGAVLTAGLTAALGSLAIGADLPVTYKPSPAATRYGWAGFYIGGNVGYAWAKQDITLTALGTTFTNSVQPKGFVGGGQAGYNWQTGSVVFGLEADIQGSGLSQSSTVSGTILGLPATQTSSLKMDWFGTVRGRAGVAFDRWLPYVTGGWVYGQGSATASVTVAGVTATATGGGKTTDGWTIGGGVETALTDRWSVKAEYLYIDFGSSSGASVSGFTASNVKANLVRGGINYRF